MFNIAVYSPYALYNFVVKDGVFSWATEHNFDSFRKDLLCER